MVVNGGMNQGSRRNSLNRRGPSPRARHGQATASPRKAAENFLNINPEHAPKNLPLPPAALAATEPVTEEELIAQLQQTVEEQRFELEKRQNMICALQRNAANLSVGQKKVPVADLGREDHQRSLQQLSKVLPDSSRRCVAPETSLPAGAPRAGC